MYDYEETENRRRGERFREQVRSFTNCVRDYILKIKDIVMIDAKSNLIDLDALIDILTDSKEESEETLELWAVKTIREKESSKCEMNQLLNQMKDLIEHLPLKDNVRKWWMSFRNAGNGGGESKFQIKKIREYMDSMQGSRGFTKEQEQIFKNRNEWTYKQLSNACSHPH